MATERHDVRIQFGVDGINTSISQVERFNRVLQALQNATQQQVIGGGLNQRTQQEFAPAIDRVQQRLAVPPLPFSPAAGAGATVSAAQSAYARALRNLTATLADEEATVDQTQQATERAQRAFNTLTNALRNRARLQEQLAQVEREAEQIQRVDNQTQSALNRIVANARREYAQAQRDAARETREQARAAQQLERQRAAAYAQMDREQQSAFRQLDTQRRRAYAEQARKEAEAQERTAVQQGRALPQAEVDQMLAQPVRTTEDTDRTYRARQVLADRELAARAAGIRLQETINAALAGTAGTENQARAAVGRAIVARDAANRSVIAAEEGLAKALRAAEIAATQGIPRSFRENFVSGFRGRGENPAPIAEQFGQAAKFSVLYGGAYHALFALTQTLQATLLEGIAFQDAMTDLRIATGRPIEELEDLGRQLGAASVAAGAAPSQGIQVGARSLGLYGVTQGTAGEQDRVARISAEVVSRLAVGSEKQPVELQGQIAAIAQALKLGPEGQFAIADLDAYFTRQFGIAQGSTLQTVAESGTLGIAAGFDPRELFAISANIQSRTGQTDSAVAGFLAQIFSRGGEGSLTTVAEKYGVDPNQELADVVRQLSEVFRAATPQQQSEIAASFGRGRVQGVAVSLLGDFPEIERLSEAARGGAASGAADEQFELRMRNIGGQLAQLQGHFQEFAGVLGESGLLDAFAAGVYTLDQFLEATTGVLRVFNELPRPVRDVILGMGALAAVLRFGGAGVIAGRATSVGLIGTSGVAARAAAAREAALLSAAGLRGIPATVVSPAARDAALAAGGATATRAAVTGATTGLLAAGRAALSFVGPVGFAIGGLMAIGALRNSADRARDAMDSTYTALQQNPITPDSTPDQILARASELEANARLQREATGGFENFITGGRADDDNIAAAERLEADAARLRELARLNEERAVAPRSVTEASAFASFDPADIADGMEAITAAGGTAGDRLDALRASLYGTADAAQAATERFDAEFFAADNADSLATTLQNVLDPRKPGGIFAGSTGLTAPDPFAFTTPDRVVPNTLGDIPGNTVIPGTRYTSEDYRRELTDRLSPEVVKDRLQQEIEARGIDSPADFTRGVSQEVAEGVVGPEADAIAQLFDMPTDVAARLKRQWVRAFARGLRQNTRDVRQVIGGRGPVTPEAATVLINQTVSDITDQLAQMPEKAYDRRAGALQQGIRDVRAYMRQGGSSSLGLEAIANLRQQLVQSQLDEAEDLRQVALRNARSRRDAVRVSRQAIRRMIRTIVRSGDADQLAALLESAGAWAAAAAQNAVDNALEVARAAQAVQAQLASLIPGIGGVIGLAMGAASIGQNMRLEELQAAIGTTPSGTLDGEISTYSNSPRGRREAERLREEESSAGRERATAAEIAAARAGAFAERQDSDVARARAAVAAARARVDRAKGRGLEYWEAMEGLFAAQNGLAEALEGADEQRAAEAQERRDERAEGLRAAAARASAYATRSGSQIAAARAGIRSARAEMAAAERGSAEFYGALESLFSARQAVIDALRQYRLNRALLSTDMTNPLRVAQAEARAAARQLRQDIRRGQGRDVIAQDRVDLRNARANAESTRFNQRLEAVQTADELGRISHSRYLDYLDNERVRLTRIRDRTYQQQQQLDQINRLIKDANSSLAGQFNFGDINLPKPYQVRRFMEQQIRNQESAPNQSQAVVQNTVNMQVNGADTQKVKQIVRDVVGAGARINTTATRRR